MLNSGSCDGIGPALNSLISERAEELARRLPFRPDQAADPQTLGAVARDFAELFYSLLVQQMQKTVRQEGEDEEEAVVREGVQDFVGMFLPKAVAGAAQDSLARYIFEHLGSSSGEQVDERA
jgi:hypothetical protein